MSRESCFCLLIFDNSVAPTSQNEGCVTPYGVTHGLTVVTRVIAEQFFESCRKATIRLFKERLRTHGGLLSNQP
jgi:hypothetical protein